MRVVAATHRDLRREVAAGRFREDLYFRLDVLPIHLPPLRERPGDLRPLARALLDRVAARLGRPCPPLAPSAEPAAGKGGGTKGGKVLPARKANPKRPRARGKAALQKRYPTLKPPQGKTPASDTSGVKPAR